ncbi:MAG: KUP/HAK/KT family potassium transporter [Spirochaetes bacterium]|nr:KUP/HAK/KT family potassium transporter [Spirochaetota bacterium]
MSAERRGTGAPRSRLIQLSIGALGVVFGDIGTSPLYTLKECFNPEHGFKPDPANVLGVLSLIFWALMLVVVFKYVLLIMRADHDGEGGVISLLALVSSQYKKSAVPRVLVGIGLAGTALLLADGMITPAISVLGAVEGLSILSPSLAGAVVPISAAILIGVFFVQHRGTTAVGRWFGPIIIVWFATIGILGARSILACPQVLAAVDPRYAAGFFIHHGPRGFLILASVVLAVTGAEALYADIGHFGKFPIRLGWFALAMPALLLNYFGQGAAVITHGAAVLANPFYFIAPHWFLIPLLVIATAAAVIASQALITGAFSLVQQGIQLGYIPKMRIVHTSHDVRGQIYIPLVNGALLVACLFLVFSFKTSGNLASAYGISVMGTMLCTSILFIVHWRGRGTPWAPVLGLLAVFLAIDLSFLLVNTTKIATGGWFPLLVGGLFFATMQTWKWGKSTLGRLQRSTPTLLDNLLMGLKRGDMPVARVPGTAVFLLENSQSRLSVLWHHLKYNKALCEKVVLLSVEVSQHPYVAAADRLEMTRRIQGFLDVSWTHGYMETPEIGEICRAVTQAGFEIDPRQVTYYLGRVNFKVRSDRAPGVWFKQYFALLFRNASGTVDELQVPPNRVVEVGAQVEI